MHLGPQLIVCQISLLVQRMFWMSILAVSLQTYPSFYGYSDSPVAWSYYLAVFVCLQAFVVILQDELGPAFFLPAKVCLRERRDQGVFTYIL